MGSPCHTDEMSTRVYNPSPPSRLLHAFPYLDFIVNVRCASSCRKATGYSHTMATCLPLRTLRRAVSLRPRTSGTSRWGTRTARLCSATSLITFWTPFPKVSRSIARSLTRSVIPTYTDPSLSVAFWFSAGLGRHCCRKRILVG